MLTRQSSHVISHQRTTTTKNTQATTSPARTATQHPQR